MLIRKPHVAGSFYPSDSSELREFCGTYLKTSKPENLRKAKAVVLPHAGYVYSGQTACKVLSRVSVPETVFLMGPDHWGAGGDFSLYSKGLWETPLGQISVDLRFAQALADSVPGLQSDEKAHSREHSLEVLLPFLQFKNPALKMVPLIVGTLDFEKAAETAAQVGAVLSSFPEILTVVSTDMSHYEGDDATRRKDRYALDAILALDEIALVRAAQKYDITMCGLVPVFMLLVMKESLGISKAELVYYTTSAEASGDKSRVVGYAGFIFE